MQKNSFSLYDFAKIRVSNTGKAGEDGDLNELTFLIPKLNLVHTEKKILIVPSGKIFIAVA